MHMPSSNSVLPVAWMTALTADARHYSKLLTITFLFCLGWSWTLWFCPCENWINVGYTRRVSTAHPAVSRKYWWFCHQTASRCHETARPSSQLSQIYGYFSSSAHFLLPLQWFYLGPGQTGVSVPNLHMCGTQTLPRVHHNKVFWS